MPPLPDVPLLPNLRALLPLLPAPAVPDAPVTADPAPFLAILDEYGYYAQDLVALMDTTAADRRRQAAIDAERAVLHTMCEELLAHDVGTIRPTLKARARARL